ncbi:MAG: GIY-YIG nuclease family protein [Kofleriaceae bacterium]|nr:GIY-YIG nuclease family protein [Kofleriaceae bacterium]
MPWFVYLARCADDTLYCGITTDVGARLAAHNAGKGARYTRSRRPIALLAVRRCTTKSRALRLEYRVKQLTRVQKQRLIATPALFATLARSLPRATRNASSSPPRGRGSTRHAPTAKGAAVPPVR